MTVVNKKLVLGVGFPVLFLALARLAFWGYSAMIGGGGSAASWYDYRTGERLLSESDMVVLATYLGEESQVIPTHTADDGEVLSTVTEAFQRFQLVEVLKGTATVGETIYVVNSEGYTSVTADLEPVSGEYDGIDLTVDEDYVMFLERRARPSGYPSRYGDTLWTRPGEPAIAQVGDSGRLTFLATTRYKDTIAGEGLERVSGSDAPFEMTKEDIEGTESAK